MKYIKDIKTYPLFQTFLFTIIMIIKHMAKLFCYVLRFRIVKIYLFFLFLKLYKENNFFVMKTVFYVLTITNYLFSKLKINILIEFFTKEIVEVVHFYKEIFILQIRFFILSVLRNLLTDPEMMDFLKTQMSQMIVETMIQEKKDEYTQMILYSTSESIFKFGLQYASYYLTNIDIGIGNKAVYQTITNN